MKTVPKSCPVCGVEFFARGKTCSKEHANELKRRTNIEKFGSEWAIQSDAAKEKRKATNLERYGAEHHLQTDESMAKLRATNLERYGVEYVGQSEEAKAKIRATNLERYGVASVFSSEQVQAAIRATNLERYGVEFAGQSQEARIRREATNLERYGVANPFASAELMAKVRERNLEIYGVEYASQREDVKERIRATNLKRYGSEAAVQSEEVKDRIRATNLQRYGFEWPFGSPEIIEKVNTTNLERYGVKRPLQNPEIQARAAATMAKRIADGTIQMGQRVSKINRNFAERLRSRFDLEVELEVARDGHTFDLYLPERKLFLELNPTVSHNADRSFGCMVATHEIDCGHPATPRDYHQKRALYARDNGLKLLQIYDWDIDPVERLLAGRLEAGFKRYSARKLDLRTIDRKTANRFLKGTHSQGAVRGQTHCYGLYSGDELLAVATFGKSRFGSKAEHEFLRYAVARGTIIHGGAGRLFGRFLEDAQPRSVVSYVDFDHSTGPSFLVPLGFEETEPTAPALVWSKGNQRVTSTSLLMQGADRLLGTSYGSREKSGMNNAQIMAAEGWLRVHTSGNRVFLWES